MTSPPESDSDAAALEGLIQHLVRARSLDFTGYKRGSLGRRIRRRMANIGVENFSAYAVYLDAHPDEYDLLFNTILINVTGFFRDAPAWLELRERVLLPLLRGASSRRQIRVWCAGCATGEEPYTLAMLLAEELGTETLGTRVKIYATDWDADALAHARLARYQPGQLAAVPHELRERYFTTDAGTASIAAPLRRAVIFGRHDLTADAPISKLDLVLCRNTLMYLNKATQSRVLARFHFALGDRGYLFLGRAEMLLTHSEYFVPVALRQRIFVRSDRSVYPPAPPKQVPGTVMSDIDDLNSRLRDAAITAGPVAQILLDSENRLVLFNERAAHEFRLYPSQLMLRLQDLELSYRPADLRSLLDRAREQRTPVAIAAKRPLPDGEHQHFEVTVTPVYVADEHFATSITFDDVTPRHRAQETLQKFSENLEIAYEELHSSNEELETTNEELQASNEELESTNEELQAANEEMETINEELRSTNEELHASSEQARARGVELDHVNGFLRAILGSLGSGVAVVDGELRVRLWNARAEDLWGLRTDEVTGQVFTSLDIGLPVAQLAEPLRAAIATNEVVVREVDAINRRGRAARIRVVMSPLPNWGPEGATLLMDVLDAPPGADPHATQLERKPD